MQLRLKVVEKLPPFRKDFLESTEIIMKEPWSLSSLFLGLATDSNSTQILKNHSMNFHFMQMAHT